MKTHEQIISTVAARVVSDACRRDPVVYYEFVCGMKMQQWQKDMLRSNVERSVGMPPELGMGYAGGNDPDVIIIDEVHNGA